MIDIVTFFIGGNCYAVPVGCFERVIHAVEITVLPNSPSAILGIINDGGNIVPVINARKRLHLPPGDISVSDKIVFMNTGSRTFAIVADEIGVFMSDQLCTDSEKIYDGIEYVAGIVKGELNIIVLRPEIFFQPGDCDFLENSND